MLSRFIAVFSLFLGSISASPVMVPTPEVRPQIVVEQPTKKEKKKKKKKKDKSRPTLGERSDRPVQQQQQRQEVVVPRPPQPVQEKGQRQAPVVVPTPMQRSERPTFSTNAVIPARPSRPVVVARSMPQVIVLDCNSAVYPSAVLTPAFISRRGDTLQLDNGSSWSVRHRDRMTVRQWCTGDAIVIEAARFFCWSTYKLVNYTRNESVDVELNTPVEMLSHWVVDINPYEGFLRLQDGSLWRMSGCELSNWRVNDDVIIAMTRNFFSNSYSYVLINPRAKTRLVAVFSL